MSGDELNGEGVPPRADFSAPGVPTPPLQAGEGVVPTRTPAVMTDLANGEWHRMHPLTPLLRGGFVLIIVIGYLLTTMRDRIVLLFFPQSEGRSRGYSGDPIDWITENNLVLVAAGAVLLLVLIIIVLLYISWRFHLFRISDTEVEVKTGVLFRSQRRSPLDRVQGVNLTRPLFARLIGLAKLEVVGAGASSNVKLEYLRTGDAERVRSAILALASGARRARDERLPANAEGRTRQLAQTLNEGLAGIVSGDIDPSIETASVVRIPPVRIVMSSIIHPSMVFLLLMVLVFVFGGIFGHPAVLFGLIPGVFAMGAVVVGGIFKSLRYAIAPTPDGLRVTFGLTTTITEIIPPGRIHAVEVTQSILWRPFGWYTIRVNRLSGRRADQQQKDPFNTLLPVGKLEDVRRILPLVFPAISEGQMAWLLEQGFGKPATDGFTTSPKRAWFTRPISFQRNGYLLGPDQLLFRRGRIWRKLAFFPLARTQSIGVKQGPIARLADIGTLHIHVVAGPVTAHLVGVDRTVLLGLFSQVEQAAIGASRADRSHRWASADDAPPDPAVAAGEEQQRGA